ncbi:MAG: biotin/lipoate A/B protein ligase family protein [Methanocella sp.]
MKLAQFPPYPGDLFALERFRKEREPFFSVEANPPAAVVLGCGTPASPDVRLDACRADALPVYRRKGGGGAVYLGPGVVVITGCFPPVPGRFPDAWSKRVVSALRNALFGSLRPGLTEVEGPPPVVPLGLGDLCLAVSPGEPRKILGSSLYLARDAVLYQASLLYQADLTLLSRYLGRPSLMPEYRRERSHEDFVTNLAPQWLLDAHELERALTGCLATVTAA